MQLRVADDRTAVWTSKDELGVTLLIHEMRPFPLLPSPIDCERG